jgi:hypothetical protein
MICNRAVGVNRKIWRYYLEFQLACTYLLYRSVTVWRTTTEIIHAYVWKTKSIQKQKNVSYQAQTASWRITRRVVVGKVSTHRHGNECSIWSIPTVPPQVMELYIYFLCISITEPKISNGLTNMPLHHELQKKNTLTYPWNIQKMEHKCTVLSLYISGAQLPSLSPYISITNETIGGDTDMYVVPSWIVSF